jgi:hypothetical protein
MGVIMIAIAKIDIIIKNFLFLKFINDINLFLLSVILDLSEFKSSDSLLGSGDVL